jgi:hypothetical protein
MLLLVPAMMMLILTMLIRSAIGPARFADDRTEYPRHARNRVPPLH